jgi:hypothetical protein
MMQPRRAHVVEPSHPKTIVATYLDSLRPVGAKRAQLASLLLFYGVPLAIGLLIYTCATANSQMNWSYQALSIFSIFLGLLISVQMTVFSIYNRFRVAAHEEFRVEDEEEIRFATSELKRIHSLISYLNVVSIAGIAASIFMAVTNAAVIVQETVVVCFYLHFILNALVLLRRGHSLFQRGFNEPA